MFKILRNLYFFNNSEFRESLVVNYISEPNKHIEEYLDYYCDDSLNDYAVLINGSWGSGKTWFIKRIEDKLKKNGFKRIIYISLNGISKKDVIDDEIFCALHPILSHRATKFFGKIAVGLVKASTKIDLINGGEKDTSLSISIPNLDISSALKDGEKLILIFDDLERCQMPIAEILGYINYFVEHTNSKAIILGNENEIKRNDKDKKYNNEKEKLVGTTFAFHGDAENALLSFIEELPRSDVKHILKKKVDLIIEIYNLSNYRNIRTLKQTIREFVRFHDSDFFNSNDELFDLVLKYFLIFSLEQRNSGFYEEFLKFKNSNSDDDNSENKLTSNDFKLKYGLSEFNEYILNTNTWNNIIVNNIIEKEEIKNDFKNNYFVYKADKPEWYKLWHYGDLNNVEFDDAIKKAMDKIKDCTWKEFGEVIHVVAALIYFNKNNILSEEIEETKRLALNNIEKICLEKEINLLRKHNLNDTYDNWGGYSYLGYDIEEFKDFIIKAKEMIEDFMQNGNFKTEADALLELMSENVHQFAHKICVTNFGDSLFYNIPILRSIDEKCFSNKLTLLSSEEVKVILSALRRRYLNASSEIMDKIKVEKSWLISVLEDLESIALNKTGIEKFNLENLPIKQIKIIISQM